MSMYLTRFSYTPETWARLVKNPEDRRAAARQYIESAATAIAVCAGGALSSIQTTVLLTVEDNRRTGEEFVDRLLPAGKISAAAPRMASLAPGSDRLHTLPCPS